ncbi:MAG: hypothetical protein BA871_11770 [Desulfuromonadales bacterium C00003096]|jgi:hypothetical protein|nr:MAG: hypothetical protein BA871_11770 [Desulfuromonadales bacterium C00003096]
MKHQQYETWILLGTELDLEQHRELQVHLKQCSQCQSLYQATHQIAHLFKTNPVPEPSPGFSARWMTRIEKVENRKSRLILGVTLSVISLATLLMLSSVGLQIRAGMAQFPQLMLEMVTLVAKWIIFLNQLRDIVSPLIRVSMKLISPIWLITLGFSLSGITIAWMISLSKSRTLQRELHS